MRRAVTAVALACALGVAAATPALAVDNPSPRYYTGDDGTSDEYGGPGLSWSGPADYGPGRSGDEDDEAFALGGRGHLAADDASEGDFGTRPFTMRFSARFSGAGGADEQVLSKRASCRPGSFLDVRTRDGQVFAELRGAGNSGVGVLHPANVHDGQWHVITVSRDGSALSVAVDGEAVSRRAGGVVDLDNAAPVRFGDGPCVGDSVTRASMLLDDVSYGPGVLPTELPLVPGLPLGGPSLGSILGPGSILAPGGSDDDSGSASGGAAETRSAPRSNVRDSANAESASVPAQSPADRSAVEPALAAAAGPAAPPAPARRAPTTAVGFPADSGAAAGIAAAVLPGAGDAADRSMQSGLDWTGALVPPRDVPRPAPAGPLPVEPPAAAPLVPSPPAPLSRDAPAYDRGIAAAAFADALRSPAEVRWDLGAIAQSLLLTLGLLALLALPVGAVNSTAEANAGRIGAALTRLRVPAVIAWTERLPLAAAVTAVAAMGAVLYAFLEPALWFDESSLALVLGLALAFLVITVAQQVPRSAYMDQWWGIRGQLSLFPGFLVLGLACVVASRVFGLEPGLILGTLMAFGTAKALRPDEEGPAVAVSAVSLTVVGLIAWFSRDAVVAAAGARGSFLPDTLDAALTAVAGAAAGNVVFMLVPLGLLDGAALFRWSKVVWAVLAGIGAFAFVHVLLAASSDAGALAGRATFLAVLVGAYLLAAAAFWAWFHYRTESTTAGRRERELVG